MSTEADDGFGGVVIGLDLGTSGLKGIAINGSGAVLARASVSYPTSRPAAGAAEQDPADWIAAVEQVAVGLGAQAPPDRWQAIGLSAMIPTLVTAGPDGEPIGPAITWEDSRAERQADRLRAAFPPVPGGSGGPGGDELYRLTGQWVDGRYLLPMFARLAEAEPDRATATRWLLGAKDYLFSWLTGQVATDPSTATGFGCFDLLTGQWNSAALAAAGLAGRPGRTTDTGGSAFVIPPELPAVLPSTATRPLRRDVAARLGCGQIPVCLGAADSVLGALGLGARSAGQVAYVAGTSTVILGVADQPLRDPEHRFLVTPLAEPGRWGLEMDLLATGSALRWLAELLGGELDEAAVVALAAGTDPATAPVVLPYLSPGEQGALWDPALHGAITGLTLGHGRRHLARGLVTGIVLESRRCLAVLDEAGLHEAELDAAGLDAAGSFGAELLVAGGSAAEASFRTDLADATSRRVVMPAGPDTDFSARGAAMLAAQAVGLGESTAASRLASSAGPAATPDADVRYPDPGRRALWDELWTTHERARLAVSVFAKAVPG